MAAINSLIVRLRTSGTPSSGTRGEVYFGIGTREWCLGKGTATRFSKGDTDTFHLEALDDLHVEP